MERARELGVGNAKGWEVTTKCADVAYNAQDPKPLNPGTDNTVGRGRNSIFVQLLSPHAKVTPFILIICDFSGFMCGSEEGRLRGRKVCLL